MPKGSGAGGFIGAAPVAQLRRGTDKYAPLILRRLTTGTSILMTSRTCSCAAGGLNSTLSKFSSTTAADPSADGYVPRCAIGAAVCAFFALMMTISFYRFLKSISPALVAFVLLLIVVLIIMHWTFTRTEPAFWVNLERHSKQADAPPAPPHPASVVRR